jgi:hypothetical protein
MPSDVQWSRGAAPAAEAVLFCPFCRESFEGQTQCPSHGLLLVPFRELPPEHDEAKDTRRLPRLHLGYGRGWVLAFALLTLAAFFLPVASLSGQMEVTNSMLELARGRATRLWLVPLAACAQLVVLHRRRSLAGMRGARAVALVFAVLPSIAVATTLFGVYEAAGSLSERMGSRVQAHVGVGAVVTWLAAALGVYGSARLGVRPLQRVREAQPDSGRSDSGR